MARDDGRRNDQLRNIKITRDYIMHPEGSVLIEAGNTKVICNATVENSVPGFLKGTLQGWVTAEYAMLPRATATRNTRDIKRLKENARSVEIQRLIGRSLRAAVDMSVLGERSIVIDCDVIQADGGTRTAAITGGFVALYDACSKLVAREEIEKHPVTGFISAVSVGIVGGVPMLDLCYSEDSAADVDLNVVMAGPEKFVEIQGTGENSTFDLNELNRVLEYAMMGSREIFRIQQKALGIES